MAVRPLSLRMALVVAQQAWASQRPRHTNPREPIEECCDRSESSSLLPSIVAPAYFKQTEIPDLDLWHVQSTLLLAWTQRIGPRGRPGRSRQSWLIGQSA